MPSNSDVGKIREIQKRKQNRQNLLKRTEKPADIFVKAKKLRLGLTISRMSRICKETKNCVRPRGSNQEKKFNLRQGDPVVVREGMSPVFGGELATPTISCNWL